MIQHPKTFEIGNLDPGSTPFGHCQCGCGAITGSKNGRRNRFIDGHSRRKPIQYVVEDRGYETPCWIWQQRIDPQNGYGKKGGGKSRTLLAHRVYYEFFFGAIPAESEIDHLCRVRACVNPEHLELVSHRENMRRGQGFAGRNTRKSRCPKAHSLSGDNLYQYRGKRLCRACRAEYFSEKPKVGEMVPV